MVTRHTAIDTLIPCTIQKFLFPLRISALWVVSTGHLFGFLTIAVFPMKVHQFTASVCRS